MESLTQTQREALMALIIAARYADGTLSLSEASAARTEIEALPWDSGSSRDLVLQQLTASVRNAMSSAEKKTAFLSEHAGLFTEAAEKNLVLESLKRVLRSDGLNPKENEFLSQLQHRLGL